MAQDLYEILDDFLIGMSPESLRFAIKDCLRGSEAVKDFLDKRMPEWRDDMSKTSGWKAFEEHKGQQNEDPKNVDIGHAEERQPYDPEWAADELLMYLDSDSDLYHQQFLPMLKNVARKIKRGIYDPKQAPKLWMYLVDAAAKKYYAEGLEHQDIREWNKAFPKQVREKVAQEIAKREYEKIKNGEYSTFLNREKINMEPKEGSVMSDDADTSPLSCALGKLEKEGQENTVKTLFDKFEPDGDGAFLTGRALPAPYDSRLDEEWAERGTIDGKPVTVYFFFGAEAIYGTDEPTEEDKENALLAENYSWDADHIIAIKDEDDRDLIEPTLPQTKFKGSLESKSQYKGTQNRWDVYLDDEMLDSVFFDADMEEDQVKRSLVDHDGYDPGIEITKEPKKKVAGGLEREGQEQGRALEFEELPEEIQKSFIEAKLEHAVVSIIQGVPNLFVELDIKDIPRKQLEILIAVPQFENLNISTNVINLIYQV